MQNSYHTKIKWKYSYNDNGALFIITAYDIDDEYLDSVSVTIKEDIHLPKIFGWKTALIDAVKNAKGDIRGMISAIRASAYQPYFFGSEDPHWM